MRKIAFIFKILAGLVSVFKYVDELNHWLLEYPFMGVLEVIFRSLAIIMSFYSSTSREQRAKHTSCDKQSHHIGRPMVNKKSQPATHRSLKCLKPSLKIVRYRSLRPQLNQKLKRRDTVYIIIIYRM